MRVLVLVCFWSLCFFDVNAQSIEALTFEEYMRIVKKDHPLVKKADLLTEMASSQKKVARGGFDPKIEGDWNHKSFKESNYYSLVSGKVKIPTWYGIDVKAGYDRNSGIFLNDSDFLPSRGLWNAGISVPLGKGLVIDQRRAELRRADLYEQTTQQERLLMLNELLLEAADAYLSWQIAKEYVDIADESISLATTRLSASKSSFVNGDKPAIDTLESFISLQSRKLDLQKTEQALNNARLYINNYLWIEGEVPLELADETLPESLSLELLRVDVDQLSLVQDEYLLSHPMLLLYDYKIDNIDIDLKLAKEELKPDLRIEYNPLLAVADNALFDQFNAGDYKVGATFSYPILQRKQRGKLQLTKLKKKDTQYNQILKRQELNVKLDTYLNNINQTLAQYTLLEETVENYSSMLVAENTKFEIGESSIFLVNSRELKYLEGRYKQIEAGRKLISNRLIYLFQLVSLDQVL